MKSMFLMWLVSLMGWLMRLMPYAAGLPRDAGRFARRMALLSVFKNVGIAWNPLWLYRTWYKKTQRCKHAPGPRGCKWEFKVIRTHTDAHFRLD